MVEGLTIVGELKGKPDWGKMLDTSFLPAKLQAPVPAGSQKLSAVDFAVRCCYRVPSFRSLGTSRSRASGLHEGVDVVVRDARFP